MIPNKMVYFKIFPLYHFENWGSGKERQREKGINFELHK